MLEKKMLPSVVLNVSLFLIPFPSLHLNFVPTCLPAGTGLLTFAPRPSVFACLCMCLLQSSWQHRHGIARNLLCNSATVNFPCFFEFLQRNTHPIQKARYFENDAVKFARISKDCANHKNGEWSFRRSPLLRLHEIFVGTDPRTFMIFKMWALQKC